MPVTSVFYMMHYMTYFQKDKPQRRRLGMENRLRDDRGNRRDHERIERINDGERFDRNENSPSRDRQSKPGVLDVGNHDDSMYDAYSGQAMSGVAPFPSDIPPPPVLMPVPGAGLVALSYHTLPYFLKRLQVNFETNFKSHPY